MVISGCGGVNPIDKNDNSKNVSPFYTAYFVETERRQIVKERVNSRINITTVFNSNLE
jgi:hypothetical protein